MIFSFDASEITFIFVPLSKNIYKVLERIDSSFNTYNFAKYIKGNCLINGRRRQCYKQQVFLFHPPSVKYITKKSILQRFIGA